MRKLLLAIILLAIANVGLEAAEVVGKVDLIERKARRAAVRYSGTDLGEVAPPPPMVAVVYLKQTTDGETEPVAEVSDKPKTAVMRQEGLQFYPAVLPIEVGTSVSFPNYDNTYHNVFSYSPEKRFDLGRYSRGEESPIVVFDQPGEVRIFCEVHEHMRAVILVLETPYFAPTDSDGNYVINDIPPGKYIKRIWQINRPVEEEIITVTDDD